VDRRTGQDDRPNRTNEQTAIVKNENKVKYYMKTKRNKEVHEWKCTLEGLNFTLIKFKENNL